MERIKVSYISPECYTHDHIKCPLIRLQLRCTCLCHKILGE